MLGWIDFKRLGFAVVVSFLIALERGGWWWLWTAIGAMAWLKMLAEKGENRSSGGNGAEVAPDKVDSVTPSPAGRNAEDSVGIGKTVEVDDWFGSLAGLCRSYSGGGYYVLNMIPENVLESALKNYPYGDLGAGRSNVIALIDTTKDKSAEHGMLIHANGLSWKNWYETSKFSTVGWDEFADMSLIVDGSVVKIGDKTGFVVTESRFGVRRVARLLKEIKDLALARQRALKAGTTKMSIEVKATGSVINKAGKGKKTEPSVKAPSDLAIDIRTANFEDLVGLPGIGAAEAQLILKNRQTRYLHSVEELAELVDLKPHHMERLRGRIVFPKSGSGESSSSETSSRWQGDNRETRSGEAAQSSTSERRTASGGRVID